MHVLFVCQYNVGRSQMAAAMMNHFTRSVRATSAGLDVDSPGETLADYTARNSGHTYVLDVMREFGLDLGYSRRTPLAHRSAASADLVVSMVEEGCTPAWLRHLSTYVYWQVPDPGGRSFRATEEARRDIEARIRELLVSGQVWDDAPRAA